MYYVIISIIASFVSAFFFRSRVYFFTTFFSCLIGICVLSLYYFYSIDFLLTNNNDFFFPKIGDIDVFTFSSKSPINNFEVINILFSLFLTVSFFSTLSLFFYKDYFPEKHDIIIMILAFLSIIFITLASDMFQLIMSWLFISFVLYYSINRKDHDASEIDNVLYTSSLLIISDALFIVGAISLAYYDFAVQNEISEILELKFIWLVNPLGSIFIIAAVVFKSASFSLNSWIISILDNNISIIQTYIYSIYTSFVGAIILLHFNYYIFQHSFVSKIALVFFFLDMTLNLFRCFLHINLNRIVVYFCLSNFNYIFLSFFLGYKSFFIQMIVIQLVLSTISFVGSAFLIKSIETNDIRKINFNTQHEGLKIFSIVSYIFLPQIFIYLFTQVDISNVIFFSQKSNLIEAFVLACHMVFSFFVVLRVFLIMILYENDKELLLYPDFGKTSNYCIAVSSFYLIFVVLQSNIIISESFVISFRYLFALMCFFYFILFGFISYNLIDNNRFIYGNLHCKYPNIFLFLQDGIYFKFVFYPLSLLVNFMYHISIVIHRKLFNIFSLSELFYTSLKSLNGRLNRLQHVDKKFLVLALMIFAIFISVFRF